MRKTIIRTIIITMIIIATFFVNVNAIDENATSNNKEYVRAYFCSNITKNYNNGDCILLEKCNSNGEKYYGLIDAGRESSDNETVKEFIKAHGVTELEFLIITHQHSDHNGSVMALLESEDLTINTIYMKEFDKQWSNGGGQATYESIIKGAINKNIKVIGVRPESLKSKEISPSMSTAFEKYIEEVNEEMLKNLFAGFSENNTKFIFGDKDTNIQIFNWEIFYETDPETEKIVRETVDDENNVSLGVLIKQGDSKKAFFAGDMNNYDGDEDRLKEKIGDVDFLKLGHHGYEGSNTNNIVDKNNPNEKGYLDTLKPEYAIITNDIGNCAMDTLEWLDKNNVNYLYSSNDDKDVSVTITSDEVYLGFGSKGYKNVIKGIYYINSDSINKDYTKFGYKVKCDESNIETIEVENWEELKNVIKNARGIDVNTSTVPILNISLKKGEWNATEKITIDIHQKIILTTSENIVIKRDKTLEAEPLFYIKGTLELGKENMIGSIVLDGNSENVVATSPLIKIEGGTIYLNEKTKLCNNLNKIETTVNTTANSSATKIYSALGSAIYSQAGKIYLYGGEISYNIAEISVVEELNGSIAKNYAYNCCGSAIYMTKSSILEMKGGDIKRNKAINNSSITIKNNYISNGTISQNIIGGTIYASASSKVNLRKGRIYNNQAQNNAKIIADENKKLKGVNTNIYGVGINIKDSSLNMCEGFEIDNNTAIMNPNINLGSGVSVTDYIIARVRGIGVYSEGGVIDITNSKISNNEIDLKSKITEKGTAKDNGTIKIYINDFGGGLYIVDSNYINITDSTIIGNSTEYGDDTEDAGGGLYIINSNCTNIKDSIISGNFSKIGGGIVVKGNKKITTLDNVKIEANKATSGTGGGVYLESNSSTNIKNSSINDNFSGYGGGIYIKGEKSITTLDNVKIKSNKATTGSGGGIYAYGELYIDGDETEISKNEAETFGGGIMVKTNATIYRGNIQQNKAEEYGGGIYWKNAKLNIYENAANIEDNMVRIGEGAKKEISPANYNIIGVEEIKVSCLPTKIKYTQNCEMLDLRGGILEVKYTDGTILTISLTNENVKVTGFDNSKAGKNTLTIDWKGKTTTFDVEIIKKELSEIKITSEPTKVNYVEGENFESSGMKVEARYNDGTSKEVTEYTVTNGENLKAGQESVKISYTEKGVTKEASQAINVTKKEEKLEVKLKAEVEYKIEEEQGYIENINPKTTVEEVLNKIETNGDMKIYKDQTEIGKDEKLETGMRIKITKGEEVKEYTIVIIGDCNGNGTTNVADLTKLMMSRAESLATERDESKILKGVYEKAVDLNGDGKISIADITKLSVFIAENK